VIAPDPCIQPDDLWWKMLKAGASGYLLKDCAFEELALAIRTVISEQSLRDPRCKRHDDQGVCA